MGEIADVKWPDLYRISIQGFSPTKNVIPNIRLVYLLGMTPAKGLLVPHLVEPFAGE
jgi:hypothetical protein